MFPLSSHIFSVLSFRFFPFLLLLFFVSRFFAVFSSHSLISFLLLYNFCAFLFFPFYFVYSRLFPSFFSFPSFYFLLSPVLSPTFSLSFFCFTHIFYHSPSLLSLFCFLYFLFLIFPLTFLFSFFLVFSFL